MLERQHQAEKCISSIGLGGLRIGYERRQAHSWLQVSVVPHCMRRGNRKLEIMNSTLFDIKVVVEANLDIE